MTRPYTEKVIFQAPDRIGVERTFSKDVEEEELVWHRDREDRYVWTENKTDWEFQLDNEIPRLLDKNYIFIPKGTYHRIVKGDGELTLRVLKYRK